MPTPILATKLYIPPPPPRVAPRPRLAALLDEGLHRKLTLISAPAGFGKTTLVSTWIYDFEFPNPKFCWLSLDEEDSDPIRFLIYLVAALQTVAPAVGEGVLGVLQSPQPPQEPAGRESILTALLNDIAALPDHFVLVLDDYHAIDAGGPLGAVDQVLAFLLEHLPPQLHLVLTTREDPPLPLARLRARGQMRELRAADLRFTPAEAAGFLNQVMGLDLAPEEVAALEGRTEGWVAGLQLAALSMRGREDVAGFIKTFAGDNRYIVDYLVEEVLQRQPAQVRSFLLQTAILDRLSGPLCDAVTGQNNGSARLEVLARGNFFVVPLDDNRHWYRYHHLFAEVLSAHLRAEQPALIAALHQRASAWCAQHGAAEDAIRHALAAGDFAQAAALVERVLPAMRRNRQEAALLGWFEALPAALVRARPVLGVAYAHVLLASGELAGVAERLRDAEQWLDAPPAAEMVIVDEEAFRRLPGEIAIARAGLALASGDVPGAVTYAGQAHDRAAEDDHLTRGAAAGFLGLAAWTRGDLETAHQTYARGMASLQKAGNLSDAINGAITLAAIRIAQGRLYDAMRTYGRGLQLATAQGGLILRGAADMHVGMSEIHREYNDLPAATQHLLKSQELGEHTGFPQNRYRWRVAMARIREAEGDLDAALDLLDEAARLYRSDFSPNVRPIAALQARVWVVQGRLGEALGWAREQGLAAEDDLSYVREFEHITLARVLLARYQRDQAGGALLEAMGLLARLRQAAEAGARTGSVLEILVLQALAHQLQGDLPAARTRLQQTFTLAEPEGYVRLFVDEGEAMRLLILDFRSRQQPGSAQNTTLALYADKLLAGFGNEPANVDKARPDMPGRDAIPGRDTIYRVPTEGQLVEPLSERELDVLRLLGTGLNGPEMARQLMVSLNTLRTHTKNIYSKLGVNNRQAAVRRAEELGLL